MPSTHRCPRDSAADAAKTVDGNGDNHKEGHQDHCRGAGRQVGGRGNHEPAESNSLAIARRVGVDPAVEARDLVGTGLDDLTLRQASELIDHLKSLQPAEGGNGR